MPDPTERMERLIGFIDLAGRIAKVSAMTFACVLAFLSLLIAFVATMFWFADLVHNEAGIFIPIVVLLFALIFGIIWSKT